MYRRRLVVGAPSPFSFSQRTSVVLAASTPTFSSHRGYADFLELLKLKDKHAEQKRKEKEAKLAEKRKEEVKRIERAKAPVYTPIHTKTRTGRTRRLNIQELKPKWDTKGLLSSGQILTMDYLLLKDDEVRLQYFGGLCIAYRKKSQSFWLLNSLVGDRVEMLGYFSSPMITNMKINNKYKKDYRKSKLYYLRDKEFAPYETDIQDVEEDVLKKT